MKRVYREPCQGVWKSESAGQGRAQLRAGKGKSLAFVKEKISADNRSSETSSLERLIMEKPPTMFIKAKE